MHKRGNVILATSMQTVQTTEKLSLELIFGCCQHVIDNCL